MRATAVDIGEQHRGLFSPVKSRRTFEEAVRQIADAIRGGDLGVGDRLPSERVLADSLEISRPTLREAIRVLAREGILRVVTGPGGGMFVVSDCVPLDLIEARSAMRISEVLEVLEARRALEPRVAQLAALYGTPEDFDAMQRTIDLQLESFNDHARMSELDYRFHRLMAKATKNHMIADLMRTLLRRLEIARDMAQRQPGDNQASVDIHIRTLDAIRSGDMAAIEAAMDEHLGYLERLWESEGGRPRIREVPAFMVPGHTADEARS